MLVIQRAIRCRWGREGVGWVGRGEVEWEEGWLGARTRCTDAGRPSRCHRPSLRVRPQRGGRELLSSNGRRGGRERQEEGGSWGEGGGGLEQSSKHSLSAAGKAGEFCKYSRNAELQLL